MRTGIRVVDLLNRDVLYKKLKRNIESSNEMLSKLYQTAALDMDAIIHEYEEFDRKFDEYITDTSEYLHNALQKRNAFLQKVRRVHCSMSTMALIFCDIIESDKRRCMHGPGHSPTSINSIVGIVKAYSTRSATDHFQPN